VSYKTFFYIHFLFFKNNFIFMIPYLPYNYHPHSFLHPILMFVKSNNIKTSAHLYPTITFDYIRVNTYEQLSLPDFDQEDTIYEARTWQLTAASDAPRTRHSPEARATPRRTQYVGPDAVHWSDTPKRTRRWKERKIRC